MRRIVLYRLYFLLRYASYVVPTILTGMHTLKPADGQRTTLSCRWSASNDCLHTSTIDHVPYTIQRPIEMIPLLQFTGPLPMVIAAASNIRTAFKQGLELCPSNDDYHLNCISFLASNNWLRTKPTVECGNKRRYNDQCTG